MKKRPLIALTALASLFAVSSTHADLLRFIWSGGGAGDGINFVDPGNWGGEAANGSNVPGDVVDNNDTTNVILQTGGTSSTSVTAPFTPANPFDILIVRGGHSLALSADMNLAGIPTLLGQTGSGSTINHSAGTFTTTNLQIGSGGDATFNLSETGNLSATSTTVDNNSILRLSGVAASFSSTSLSVDAGSTLDFIFGSTGVSAIDLTGAFNVTTGALLNLDGSGYSGGPGNIDLVTFGGNTGSFSDPADITISGFTGFNPIVGYDAGSMFLSLAVVPEPSTSLLFLLGGLGLVLRRFK